MKTSRSPRRRAREFAVQGLYQLLLTGGDPRDVARQMTESEGFGRGDQPMFERLWAGTVAARVYHSSWPDPRMKCWPCGAPELSQRNT